MACLITVGSVAFRDAKELRPAWGVLPPSLHTLGLELFENDTTLLYALVRGTAQPKKLAIKGNHHNGALPFVMSVRMVLVQPPGDNAIERRINELKWKLVNGRSAESRADADEYGFRNIPNNSHGVIVGAPPLFRMPLSIPPHWPASHWFKHSPRHSVHLIAVYHVAHSTLCDT